MDEQERTQVTDDVFLEIARSAMQAVNEVARQEKKGALAELTQLFSERIAPQIVVKRADAEIAAVFSVPLDFFRQDPREHTHRIDYQGRSWYVPSYRFGVYKIWGLTAIMIVELMNLLYDDVNINLHTPPERFINI